MLGNILWFSMHINGKNTVISYAGVQLLVVFANYW